MVVAGREGWTNALSAKDQRDEGRDDDAKARRISRGFGRIECVDLGDSRCLCVVEGIKALANSTSTTLTDLHPISI